ncbi:hypothetical protein [Streptomyces sp. TS71-3]|uniref:hypothetical protein n=1 Tax=Streptomyces sp. TS71-3 TaxID=2733862 RepID=UPI001B2075A3|nr:hypothetical protein [Streptomyces sp. TS71-3]GHJ40739.1 hypothetical protein Sm713_63480 [Streptomyces sp. TS71-3]
MDAAQLTEEKSSHWSPNSTGPTWIHAADGSWLLPKRTLGRQIAGWCAEHLNGEGSTDDQPVPWKFTKEQLRFLLVVRRQRRRRVRLPDRPAATVKG